MAGIFMYGCGDATSTGNESIPAGNNQAATVPIVAATNTPAPKDTIATDETNSSTPTIAPTDTPEPTATNTPTPTEKIITVESLFNGIPKDATYVTVTGDATTQFTTRGEDSAWVNVKLDEKTEYCLTPNYEAYAKVEDWYLDGITSWDDPTYETYIAKINHANKTYNYVEEYDISYETSYSKINYALEYNCINDLQFTLTEDDYCYMATASVPLMDVVGGKITLSKDNTSSDCTYSFVFDKYTKQFVGTILSYSIESGHMGDDDTYVKNLSYTSVKEYTFAYTDENGVEAYLEELVESAISADEYYAILEGEDSTTPEDGDEAGTLFHIWYGDGELYFDAPSSVDIDNIDYNYVSGIVHLADGTDNTAIYRCSWKESMEEIENVASEAKQFYGNVQTYTVNLSNGDVVYVIEIHDDPSYTRYEIYQPIKGYYLKIVYSDFAENGWDIETMVKNLILDENHYIYEAW